MGQSNHNNRPHKFQEGNKNHQDKRPPKPPRYKGKNINPMGDVSRMGKYAINIFKDIAHGKMKGQNGYPEFQNREFLIGAISEVEKKIRENNIYVQALYFTYAESTDSQAQYLLRKHQQAAEGWNYIYNTLFIMLNTGDMGYVSGLMNRLPDFKHVLY